MLTRQDILEVERSENEHHERIHRTFAARHEGSKAMQAWHDATEAWHARTNPIDRLWEDDFLAALRASHHPSIEDAILYLEVDPWYFRSGYLKERLIRGLKSANLSAKDRRRLWNVVWNVASGKNRREFRNFCSLATIVADDDLLRLLENVSPERDLSAKGKFSYLLAHLRKHPPADAWPSRPQCPSNSSRSSK
jgi:hypothetical protein